MRKFFILCLMALAICSCATSQYISTNNSSRLLNEINEQVYCVKMANEASKNREDLEMINNILSNPIDTCVFYGYTFIKCKRDNLTTNGIYYILLNCNEETYVDFSKKFLSEIGVWRCGYLRYYGGKRKTSWMEYNTQRTIRGEYKQGINTFILSIDYRKTDEELKTTPTSSTYTPRHYYYYPRTYIPSRYYYRSYRRF